MTITYALNGVTIHGVDSRWQRIPLRTDPDGQVVYGNYALNLWSVSRAGMAAFQAMNLAQGAALTTLDTNDISDRNAAAQYTTVYLTAVDGGQHRGLFIRDLRLTFRVKVV